ncbi:MAG TPA: hypothetical protein VM029_16685 [Opitutaceae bacterium]|nr:hypothetical protein [Opitutaceae bacterium]
MSRLTTRLVYALLLGSLAGNAALALKFTPAFRAWEAAAVEHAAENSRAATHASAPAGSPHAPAAATRPSVNGVDWPTLAAGGDLAMLVARLRAAGFSESIIQAVLAAEIRERFAERRRALIPLDPPYEFWTNRSPFVLDPKLMAARRAISREQDQLLKQLLGPDAGRDPIQDIYAQRQFGDLPPGKIALAQEILRDYNEMSAEVRRDAQGLTLAEDREKLALLESEKLRDLAAVMSPAELEEYQFRNSSTGSMLRYQLALFQPSEQEFRALYYLQTAFDEKYSYTYGSAPRNDYEGRTEAERRLVADAKAALGEARGAEFERTRDYDYQTAAKVAARYGLPREAATQVWELRKDIDARAARIRMDRNLTAAARQQQLTLLHQEATARVTAALGPSGSAAYRDSSGYWLQNLAPPPLPAR